jgi:aspartyl aminopeptidase
MPITALTPPEPVGQTNHSPQLLDLIAKSAGIERSQILDFDLTFFDSNPVRLVGTDQDFVAGSRLGEVGLSYLALKAFLQSGKPKSGLNSFAAFERFAGESRTALNSNFLGSILGRIGCKPSFYSRSFFWAGMAVSALHPHRVPEIEGDTPVIGRGLVLTLGDLTGGGSTIEARGKLRGVAKTAEIPLQEFWPTSGNAVWRIATEFGIASEMVAVPVLSMGSVRELAAVVDFERVHSLFRASYEGKTA